MISQRARYAFKAMVALARAKPGTGLQIRELSEQRYLNQYAGSGDMTASQVVTSEGAGMQPRVRTAS